MPSNPFRATATGVRVAVRVQPGASRTGIDGLKTLDDGQVVLAIRVSAAPEHGKANAALVKLLAKTWKLPKSIVEVAAGHGGRRKIVQIDGDPAALQARLHAWLAGIAKAGEPRRNKTSESRPPAPVLRRRRRQTTNSK